VTRVVPKGDDFYFGFASDARGRTLYFQRPQGTRTSIWLGPWEIKGHAANFPPETGHLIFGEWEVDPRKKDCFRLKWQVSAIDMYRFRRCLEEKNTIFVRRPTSVMANTMLRVILFDDPPTNMTEVERKQLAHLCRLPLDTFTREG